MRELRSKWIGLFLPWNKRPREKAPRIFEMAEPTILPIARDARLRARDAITTASYDIKSGWLVHWRKRLWDSAAGCKRTSSHSPPAVRRPTIVSGMPVRRATIAVWSINLSAPNSNRKRVATKAAML
jgi:hypothetical protein